MQQLASISTKSSIKKIVSIILCKKKNNSRISSKVFLALDSWLGLQYQAWSPSDVADVTIVHNNELHGFGYSEVTVISVDTQFEGNDESKYWDQS